MQEPRPSTNPSSLSKRRRTGGYAFATLGLIIIAINVFIIITLKGQVPTLSKALLPLGCILILAGFCFCCIKETKTQSPMPQYYTTSNFVTIHPAVLHQNSVPDNDDFPPKYEDCVALDINNHHAVTTANTTSGCNHETTSGNSGDTVGVSSSGGDCGNSSSCVVDSGGTCDSGGGGTDSGGGCSSGD